MIIHSSYNNVLHCWQLVPSHEPDILWLLLPIPFSFRKVCFCDKREWFTRPAIACRQKISLSCEICLKPLEFYEYYLAYACR